jgi:hypothetical protein
VETTFELVSLHLKPYPQQTPDEVVALPTPPNTPGSYVTSKTDPSTLIQVGRSHAQVLASNMKSVMPVLMAYGYARDDLETLVEDCVTLVCRLLCVAVRRSLMVSCRVLGLLSIRGYLQFTLPRADKGIWRRRINILGIRHRTWTINLIEVQGKAVLNLHHCPQSYFHTAYFGLDRESVVCK